MWDIYQGTDSAAPIKVDPDKHLIFRGKSDTTPESDITIVYENAPVIVVKYKIVDEHLYIYTPKSGDVPQYSNDPGFINIQTMHVQNAAAN